jgi:hypothetical protein
MHDLYCRKLESMFNYDFYLNNLLVGWCVTREQNKELILLVKVSLILIPFNLGVELMVNHAL